MAVRVEAVERLTDDVVVALSALLPQLLTRGAPLRVQDLNDLVAAPETTLLVARDEHGSAVGTLTLVVYHLASGLQALIEHVVVDEAARGRGVGEALVSLAVRRATEQGARHVDLTSSPSRDAANRLYQRLGFEHRHTNVYRYRCTPD